MVDIDVDVHYDARCPGAVVDGSVGVLDLLEQTKA